MLPPGGDPNAQDSQTNLNCNTAILAAITTNDNQQSILEAKKKKNVNGAPLLKTNLMLSVGTVLSLNENSFRLE